ncbi:MAG: ATP-binding protein [Desulfobulbus sp.]
MISEENLHILERFALQCRTLVQEILPKLHILLAEPERDDLLLSIIGRSCELFRTIREKGPILGLEHLLAPSEAMASLLESVRLHQLQLLPRHISLLVETCSFVDQGLESITQEKSDQRLAASATALQAAIHEALHEACTLPENPIPFAEVSPEMRDAFMQESEQLLMTAEQEFVLWDFIAIDHQRVAELCRVLHRLKQNFSIYDCRDFERLCMALESALRRYIQGEFFQTEYPERTFLRCIDAMREALTQFALTEALAIADVEEHLLAVQGLIRQPLGELLIEAGLVDSKTVDDALSLQRTTRTDQPRRLGEVLVGMGEVTEEQVQQVLKQQQFNKEQIQNAETHLGISASPHPPNRSMAPLFPVEVSVDGQKLARMVSVIKQMHSLTLPPELEPFVSELEQLTRTFNNESFFGFAHHLQRVVRDFAMHFNKRVHFRLEGASVLQEEFDMATFADLLIPLLRNSVEHGVEPMEQRRETQKKKNGRILLTALRQGEEVWVSVEDDGIGFDLKKIAKLCFDQGLVSREELGNLTGAELLQIFLNNQNCADEPVAEDALHCTGLAMVKRLLRDFNGKMDIWSRPGKGSRITLRIQRAS